MALRADEERCAPTGVEGCVSRALYPAAVVVVVVVESRASPVLRPSVEWRRTGVKVGEGRR